LCRLYHCRCKSRVGFTGRARLDFLSRDGFTRRARLAFHSRDGFTSRARDAFHYRGGFTRLKALPCCGGHPAGFGEQWHC